jgi:hypothetical protein
MWWRAALAAAAVVLAAAPIPPAMVERWYASGVYPPLQRTLTGLSNRAPFALFDLLLLVALLWWFGALGFDAARLGLTGTGRVLLRLVLRTLTGAVVLYLAFVCAWGLNYRRPGLSAALAIDEAAITTAAARRLALRAVDEVNARYVPAHSELTLSDPIESPSFQDAFALAQDTVGAAHHATPGRPKRSVIDPYFRAAGVEGMIDPFFLEILEAGGLLAIERPMVVAHEWGHLAGFADEGEANFLGWLTCVRGSDAARYSGWLFLYREVAAVLPAKDRAAVAAGLGDGVRNDLEAIADRMARQVQPRVSDAGWRVYDRYLRANRVEAGAASYGEVIRLILGSRITDRALAP